MNESKSASSTLMLCTTAALLVLLGGCQTTPKTESTGVAVEERTPSTSSTTTTSSTQGGVTGSATASGNPLRDPRSILSKRSVYFDFDRYEVKDEFKPLVEAHAKYLAGNKSARMTVQGNCDERGSREYNIALGQRRADQVKRMMALYGATDGQVETVSFGKEKPRNQGHDEAAWAENRRDDMVYAGE
jgi:peptidoglycan-associated lipoprotein